MSKFTQNSKRKNKSEIGKRLCLRYKPELQDVHPEIVANCTIQHLIKETNDRIDEAQFDKQINSMLTPAAFTLKSMAQMLCPEQHEREVILIKNEREPQRVEFDPICGFDRLVTYSNKKELAPKIKKEKDPLNQIPSYKSLKKNTTHVSSSQKTQKLVPLKNMGLANQKEAEQAQIVQRDRRLYETRNFLMPSLHSIAPGSSTQNQKIKSVKASKHFLEFSSKHEEYFYGYNGQKQTLLTGMARNFGNNHFGGNHILKTTYKVNECVSKKKEERGSLQKDMEIYKRISKQIRRDSMNMMSGRVGKATIDRKSVPNVLKMLNEYSYNDQGRIKTILESEFKKNISEKVKWREKPERARYY